MSLKIGAQYYTIRDFCKTIEDFDLSCKKVSEMGYKAVQLSGIGDFSAEEIKPIIEKYGLYVVCTHRALAKFLEELDSEIEFHKAIGCPILGLGGMPGGKIEEDTIDEFVKNFKPVIEKINAAGLIFAYHNHAFEFQKIDGKYVFDIICEKLGNVPFKLILDVYWLAYAGINPAKFIREHKENIACVHFKDMSVTGNAQFFAPVGYGNLDWDNIIAACEEVGVEYALVEQDMCYDENPFDCLGKSYKFLKEKGLE